MMQNADTTADTTAELGALEAPSGKGHRDENFPVGSFLIAPKLRPHVARFYAFARATDDIADDPDLAPEEKLRRLDVFRAALAGAGDALDRTPKARAFCAMCAETGVPVQHGLDLLSAFSQDAVKGRYADWAELADYCRRSASPVGRFLLDLHGEDRALWPAADALCDALQVLNHLQDCQEDYRMRDRVYLPETWLVAEGLDVTVLEATSTPPGLRRVLDRCLDGVDAWLEQARMLVPGLRSPRLALESAVILRLAERLTGLLRAGDPLAERVALTKLDFARCGLAGLWLGWTRPRPAERRAA